MRPINDYVATVIPFLENIIYSIALYRAIGKKIQQDKVFEVYQREFWVRIMNNSVQMAIVDWCKVFGSTWRNKFHYSVNLDFELDGIETTKDQMVRFRNKYAAHREKVRVPVPVLEDALSAVYAFDDMLREEYDLKDYPTLRQAYDSYEIRIEDQLTKYEVYEI